MTNPSSSITMMKAAAVHNFLHDFDRDELERSVTIHDVPRPAVSSGTLLIKVLACSLSPGDAHMARGSIVFMHPKAFPYVPGMDVCGRVEEVSPEIEEFKVGDVVVASNGIAPQGGLAEYMAVSAAQAVLKPENVPVEQAAASSSAITALDALEDYGDARGRRVLVLGGSGGVGSAAIQLAKRACGASFVATTSTRAEMCRELGADLVLDYRTVDWWTHPDFVESKFDLIVDAVGGNDHWIKAQRVLKPGRERGRFVAVAGDSPHPDMGTYWKALGFALRFPWRPLWSSLRPGTLPSYRLLMPGDAQKGRRVVLDRIGDGSLKIVLDSSLPFTEDGVRRAFGSVAGGHAHGKVVVTM
jgi:NADPH:quinone reductase-like Zn-dependent oxidoreductase